MSGGVLIAGTTSDAGKSVLTAGICRWLARRGVKVAPFKGQNMSLNSFVTREGAEIGRAQAMQAQAARVEPTALMNPVLLKPGGDRSSQVVLLGKPVGELSAQGFFGSVRPGEPARAVSGGRREALLEPVLACLAELRATHDVVVCEGAGSPAEINLRRTDIVNMGVARAAKLPVLVVGDIDRGGVFASFFGTTALLAPEDQALVAGYVVNKFRGDVELLKPGIEMLRSITGRHTFGVLPYAEGLGIDEEDGLRISLRGAVRESVVAPPVGADVLRVAVCAVPLMSNFTDVDALAAEPGVVVRFVDRPEELADADLVVVPGTRGTVRALAWLRERGSPTRCCAGSPRGARCSASAAATSCSASGSRTRWSPGRAPSRGSACCRCGCGSRWRKHWPGRPVRRWASPSRGTRSTTASPRCWAASRSSPTRTGGPWTAAGPARSGAPTGTARWRATATAGPSSPRWPGRRAAASSRPPAPPSANSARSSSTGSAT